MVQLALVGIAGYGGVLLESIRRLARGGRCRLLAAADTRLGQLGEQAGKLRAEGVELFDDAGAMFQACRGRCQAVVIGTGIPSHMPLAVAAARAGYHLHLEKPPAATVGEVDAMLEALAAAGRFCQVGFNLQQRSDALSLKQQIVAGRIGRVLRASAVAGWPRTRAYYTRNPWSGKLRSGSTWVLDGPAMNALAHQVMMMLYLCGQRAEQYAQPVSVRGELYTAGPIEAHDTAAIEIVTDGGARAYFLASHCSEGTFGPIVEVHGERGRAVLASGGAKVFTSDGGVEKFDSSQGGREEQFENLCDAIEANDAALLRVPLQQARNMVLALDGAYESSGKVHRIDPAICRTIGEGDEQRTVVKGLDAMLLGCAARCELFSDAAAAWAVKTDPFDLAGYAGFPQRFQA